MRVSETQKKFIEERSAYLISLFGVKLQDLKFLEEAIKQEYNNRNMLKNSYVYAFNFTDKNILPAEKNLFEYLQDDLERHTDYLSELLELNIEEAGKNNFLSWKENVTNYTKVCKKFLNNFIEGTTQRSLLHVDAEYLYEKEKLFSDHIEVLQKMGVEKNVSLPFLIQYEGDIQAVIAHIFK